jgi:hypothetical protein
MVRTGAAAPEEYESKLAASRVTTASNRSVSKDRRKVGLPVCFRLTG